MRRSVRVPDHAKASIDAQLPADRAEVFRAHNLPEAIEALSLVDWWGLPEIEQSPGIRRLLSRRPVPSRAITSWSGSIPGPTIRRASWFTSSTSGPTGGRTGIDPLEPGIDMRARRESLGDLGARFETQPNVAYW